MLRRLKQYRLTTNHDDFECGCVLLVLGVVVAWLAFVLRFNVPALLWCMVGLAPVWLVLLREFLIEKCTKEAA